MSSEPSRPGPPPASTPPLRFPFSLLPFDVLARDYVTRCGGQWDGLAVGALIFSHLPPADRVLLIQRDKSDSLPEKWEIPSGVVSNNPSKDATVLQAVVRELWEETGLLARELKRVVNAPGEEGFVFSNSTKTKVFCRFVFEVGAAEDENGGMEIRLNPAEHQDFVWATEEEVRERVVERDDGGKQKIDLTSDSLGHLIQEAFRLRKEGREN
ncbi:NUDIX hydrolase domain-like protein [Ustulina deusta]|nr:NUDIX hydrolase domain-like protein [Ustulina deusta]KAI3335694.1 NUDIX hydrolase domain-like protein [Ustulina deusta]